MIYDCLSVCDEHSVYDSDFKSDFYKLRGNKLLELDENEYLFSDLFEKIDRSGYSFILKDLKLFIRGQFISNDYTKYLPQFSEADLKNPEALRRIILGNEAEKAHAVRTLLLGPGGAGKSSLADRLQGKPVEQIKVATQGIEYQNHQPLDLQKTFPESNPEEKRPQSLPLGFWRPNHFPWPTPSLPT